MNTYKLPVLSSRRGAVLIVALLLACGLAISIGSYITIARNNLKIAGRAFYSNAAMNLAETGLEEAMWLFNFNRGDDLSAWNSWRIGPSFVVNGTFRKKFGPFDLGQNTVGYTRVYISTVTTTADAQVFIVAKSTVTPPNEAPIEKWITVELRKRSKFANGLVAKRTITFRGNNSTVDSWNSEPSNIYIPYSSAVRRDKGTVGSISVAVDVILVQNADIWGYVSTASDDVTDNVGVNGSVLGSDSAAKDKSSWTKSTVDPDRVSTDFIASIDPVTAPSTTYDLGNVNSNLTLPRAEDNASSDGKYYYSTSGVSLTNKTLTISGFKKVVLVSSSGDISVGGGSGLIQINNGGTLDIYAGGNVSISGNGVANGTPSSAGAALTATQVQQPKKFRIWGTNTTSQSIDIKGNGALSGVVYAPTASVFVNGNGDVMGSIVANDITMVGNAAFHYDEALAGHGDENPYGISKWTELTTSAQRATYSGYVDF